VVGASAEGYTHRTCDHTIILAPDGSKPGAARTNEQIKKGVFENHLSTSTRFPRIAEDAETRSTQQAMIALPWIKAEPINRIRAVAA